MAEAISKCFIYLPPRQIAAAQLPCSFRSSVLGTSRSNSSKCGGSDWSFVTNDLPSHSQRENFADSCSLGIIVPWRIG